MNRIGCRVRKVVQEDEFEPFEIEVWVEKDVEESDDEILTDQLDILEKNLEDLISEKMKRYLQEDRED